MIGMIRRIMIRVLIITLKVQQMVTTVCAVAAVGVQMPVAVVSHVVVHGLLTNRVEALVFA